MDKRPLGIVSKIVEEIGLQDTYSYDDLIFIEHNPFLVQFDDEMPTNLKIFFNVDCDAPAAAEIICKLTSAAANHNFTVEECGQYEMIQKEGANEFDIKFVMK